MTKQQENRAFAKMLKEFPKAFGRVSFRERLMLRAAFTYITEEVITDIKANCDLAIEGRDVKIKELEKENAELRKNGFTVSAMTEQQLKVAIEKGEQLEKDFRICEQNADTYYDQLVKAKEIIKDLMSFSVQLCDCRHTVDFEKTREQAVQFIKEIEK